uniref:Uncharacterized protein n=1 Tax=Cacopsylla melanoneura TaxID=428564 RepID=A0A8D9ED50_9HEMI
MVVKMSTPLDPPEELASPPLLPAATSFVVSFDSPQPPVNSRLSNKFVKRHMRNLSLPVANVYNNNTSKINNNYSNSNGIIKPLENHSEGYFSSDPEDEDKHVQITKPNTDISMSTSLDSSRLSQLGKSRVSSIQDNKLGAKSKATQENRSIADNVAKSRSIQENGAKEIEDEDKSDGGTYTIDQDSNEVINARLSIDRTFGITTTEHKFK